MSRGLVLVTLLAVAALTGCSDDDAEPAGSPVAEPVAPEGMIYVGIDGVVVPVPEDWRQGFSPLCGGTVADAYWFAEPDPPRTECPRPRSGTETTDFLEIHPVDTPGVGSYPCFNVCPEVWELDGVEFFVGAAHPSVVAGGPPPTLRLPEGWTTVPPWPGRTTRTSASETFAPVGEDEYRAILGEAGLADVVRIDDAGTRATTPDQGTVVEVP